MLKIICKALGEVEVTLPDGASVQVSYVNIPGVNRLLKPRKRSLLLH